MRKIDDKTHRRFITALEKMIGDMDASGFSATADELVVSHCELEDIYLQYNRKIEEVNRLIRAYFSMSVSKGMIGPEILSTNINSVEIFASCCQKSIRLSKQVYHKNVPFR